MSVGRLTFFVRPSICLCGPIRGSSPLDAKQASENDGAFSHFV